MTTVPRWLSLAWPLVFLALASCTSGSQESDYQVDDQPYYDHLNDELGADLDASRFEDAYQSYYEDTYGKYETYDAQGLGEDYSDPSYSAPSHGNGNIFDTSGSCPIGCTTHVSGCDVKGNVSFETGERIYHVPGQEYYTATKIDPDYGERWFCTEADAIANGWRKSRR